MKKLLILATLLAMLASFLIVGIPSTRADGEWNGPGWYVVAYQYAVILWSGPYATKDVCERAKPANDNPPGFEYDCSWFDRNPQ